MRQYRRYPAYNLYGTRIAYTLSMTTSPADTDTDTVTLYRAAEEPEAWAGAHFTPGREDALEYTDNPGFGGPRVYRFDVAVEDATVLRCEDADGLEILAQAYIDYVLAGEDTDEDRRYAAYRARILDDNADIMSAGQLADYWQECGHSYVFQVLEFIGDVLQAIEESGYQWVVFRDDYPEGCETWRYLGNEHLVGRA